MMTFVDYSFANRKDAESLSFMGKAIDWLKESVGYCRESVVSGRQKQKGRFEQLMADVFELEITRDMVINGDRRAKIIRGDGWVMLRFFRREEVKAMAKTSVHFRIVFEDDVQALQFKLAMS
jgi:hypothetical protein